MLAVANLVLCLTLAPMDDSPSYSPEQREAIQYGGADCELVSRTAPAWLLCHVEPNGSWSTWGYSKRCVGPACDPPFEDLSNHPDVASTGLALAVFVSMFHTHRDGPTWQWRRQFRRSLRWLLDQQQEDGLFGKPGPHSFLNHVVALHALQQAQRLSRDDFLLRGPLQRALDYLYQEAIPSLLLDAEHPARRDFYAIHFLIRVLIDHPWQRGADLDLRHPDDESWLEKRAIARTTVLPHLESLAHGLTKHHSSGYYPALAAVTWRGLLTHEYTEVAAAWREHVGGTRTWFSDFEAELGSTWARWSRDWPTELITRLWHFDRFLDEPVGCDRGSVPMLVGEEPSPWLRSRVWSTALNAVRARGWVIVYHSIATSDGVERRRREAAEKKAAGETGRDSEIPPSEPTPSGGGGDGSG